MGPFLYFCTAESQAADQEGWLCLSFHLRGYWCLQKITSPCFSLLAGEKRNSDFFPLYLSELCK